MITGIATQGFEALSDYYVRRYKVSLSRNGHTWSILSVSINLTLLVSKPITITVTMIILILIFIAILIATVTTTISPMKVSVKF